MKPFYVDTWLIVLREFKGEVTLKASSITRSAKATVNNFQYICGQKLELHVATGSYLDDTWLLTERGWDWLQPWKVKWSCFPSLNRMVGRYETTLTTSCDNLPQKPRGCCMRNWISAACSFVNYISLERDETTAFHVLWSVAWCCWQKADITFAYFFKRIWSCVHRLVKQLKYPRNMLICSHRRKWVVQIQIYSGTWPKRYTVLPDCHRVSILDTLPSETSRQIWRDVKTSRLNKLYICVIIRVNNTHPVWSTVMTHSDAVIS